MPNGDPAAADQRTSAPASAARKASAFAVHVMTASGAALGLLALMAAVAEDWPLMFWFLGAALIVDGIDGTIARYVRVSAVLPRWSGDSLDFAVDFVTYVFVPAYAIANSGLLPPLAEVPAAILVVLTGALYFADLKMKMAGNYFRGFPALWNVAAFYLFVVRPHPWVGVAAIVVLAGLTFAPFPFIHPLRVARWRILNITLLVVWSLLAAAALGRNLDAGPWISAALCAIALYFIAAGLIRRSGESHGSA
jgi:phosphatidylcholine synthase